MKRKFNYTGREKLTRDSIKISTNKLDGKSKSISVNINLNEIKYSGDTKIYLDAYHKTDRKRFDFGKINERVIPEDLTIDELSYTDNLMFRLLLIDESGERGKIIAHADRIRADENADKKPILPVRFDDLGQQVWKLEFMGDEGGPILCVNSNIPAVENLVKSDSVFFMFVFPAAIREILTHMIFIDKVENQEEPSVVWHSDWLKYSKIVLPNETIPNLEPEEREDDIIISWIDQVVEEFCNSRRIEWETTKAKLMGE
jgi:hypothetical protein